MFKSIIRLTTVTLFGILLLLSVNGKAYAQKPKIRWLSPPMADSALVSKPVLIDLYTTWCGWCKVMDKKTYTNSSLAAYVNEKFYPVKYDAENRSAIKWKGKTFLYSPSYKVNEFAVFLTQGRLAFPTTVIIPADGSEPQAIAGYLKPADMEVILKFFGEKAYKQMSFESFQKQLKRSW